MRSIFIDSDILLDILLNREPFYEWAIGILLLIDKKEYNGCTSVHGLLNAHYLTKKHSGEKAARAAIKSLAGKLEIITEDAMIINMAIESDFADFEDAVQFYAAKSAGVEAIITRNIKHYKQSAIPVLTAEQFLRTL